MVLAFLSTLLAHVQLVVTQHPQILFLQAALQPLLPKLVALHGVVVTQVQDSPFSLVESHLSNARQCINKGKIPFLKLSAYVFLETHNDVLHYCSVFYHGIVFPS